MWVWFDRLGALVLDASLASIALWGVVTVVTLGCRQPARRIRLGRAAVVGSLALLPLIGFGLMPRLDVLSVGESLGLVPHSIFPPRRRPPAPTPVVVSWAFGLLSPAAAGPWPARVLTVVYLAGVGCGLGWLALGLAGLARLGRESAGPSAAASRLYDSLPVPAGMRRPGLRVQAGLRRPVLVGVFRPLILIPPGLDHPESRDRLRLSLLHELAHAEAGDAGFALVSGLAQALWFFAPPVWWVTSQLRLDQEFLADRRASDRYGPAPDYASSLVDLATPPGAFGLVRFAHPGVGARADSEPRSPLFQRVLMLLHCPFPIEPKPPPWWSWGLPVVVAAVTLAASSLSVRPPAARAVGASLPNSFRVSRLELPPGEMGRSPLVELPVRLTDRFDLTVEVWADLASLAATRLLGLPLRSTRLDDGGPNGGLPTWHVARVRRDRQGVELWVDGHTVALDPVDPPLTHWLSVQPAPDGPARFKNLVLTW